MTESEFLKLAEATLDAIEAAVQALVEADEADLDATRSGNVLTLELADDSKIVVNSQAPMRQLWVAAKSGGYHYEQRDGSWIDTRDGGELFATLSKLVSAQGGVPVRLIAR